MSTLFPTITFNKHGKIEIANDMLLEGTGLTDEDIKTGTKKITTICESDFMEAMDLAMRGETRTVCGLRDVMWLIGQKSTPYSAPDYKSAVLFPYFGDAEHDRAIVMFLPFEYRPDNL